mmetsp:Transcript_46345/g.107890  ORF Transcript_46345/g.107890 Transcript_46345/m.107890 type:complete len:655 (-) Transcript_46345:48-2012(-)
MASPSAPATSSPGRPQPRPLVSAAKSGQEASVDEHIDDKIARKLQGLDLNAIVTSEMRVRETAMEERIMGVMKDMLASSMQAQLSTGSRPASTLSQVSREADAGQSKLSHKHLVSELEDKAIAEMQTRADFGFTDVVIRDVVSSVVKDLVGVMEALTDRLLREKKQDTIRAMVAELVTEDITQVVSVGREMLLKQEVGHLVKDMERLRAEVRQIDAAWNERFKIIEELKASQNDLWLTIDERHTALEACVKDLEGASASKDELKATHEAVTKHVEEKHAKVVELSAQRDRVESQLREIDAKLEEISLFKNELNEAKETLASKITAVDEKCATEFQAHKEHAAAASDLQQLKTDHEATLQKLQESSSTAHQGLDSLQAMLKDFQASVVDTYTTKEQVKGNIDEVSQILTTQLAAHAESMQKLEAEKACKQAVEDAQKTNHGRWEVAEEQAKMMAAELERHVEQVEVFKAKCKEDYATHDKIEELMQGVWDRLRKEFDAKQEIAILQRSIDAEKERNNQSSRLQHTTREDLNVTMEQVQQLKSIQTDFGKRAEELSSSLGALDQRESGHWQQEQAASALQTQAHKDLEVLLQSMRDDLASHVEFQNAEGSKLKQDSTKRYFEQMEKALQLQETVEKVEHGHKELEEEVRGVRLPPV